MHVTRAGIADGARGVGGGRGAPATRAWSRGGYERPAEQHRGVADTQAQAQAQQTAATACGGRTRTYARLTSLIGNARNYCGPHNNGAARQQARRLARRAPRPRPAAAVEAGYAGRRRRGGGARWALSLTGSPVWGATVGDCAARTQGCASRARRCCWPRSCTRTTFMSSSGSCGSAAR